MIDDDAPVFDANTETMWRHWRGAEAATADEASLSVPVKS
jgi:hypothetical protein